MRPCHGECHGESEPDISDLLLLWRTQESRWVPSTAIRLRPLRPSDAAVAVKWSKDFEFCAANGWRRGLTAAEIPTVHFEVHQPQWNLQQEQQ